MSAAVDPVVVQIRLRISNAFLVVGSRPILVDTGCPNESGAIVRALEREGLGLADLALILHTHGHNDHCGSTRELKRKTSAPAAIHRGDADMLRRGRNGPLIPSFFTARLIKPFLAMSFPPVTADLVFEDELDLRPFGVGGRVIHTPGHTAGSVSLVTESGAAIVGDLLMGGYLGGKLFPRRPRYHYFADDIARERQELKRILNMTTSTIYVGHGGPLRREDILKWLGPGF